MKPKNANGKKDSADSGNSTLYGEVNGSRLKRLTSSIHQATGNVYLCAATMRNWFLDYVPCRDRVDTHRCSAERTDRSATWRLLRWVELRDDTDSAGEQIRNQTTVTTNYLLQVGRTLFFVFFVLGILVGPAAGQEETETPAEEEKSDICNSEELVKMIEGFFRVTTTLGAIGLGVVLQADSLAEMFTLTQNQRQALKRHKRQALKSGVILFTLGPVYTYAGPVMNLPLASCIDLIPWI